MYDKKGIRLALAAGLASCAGGALAAPLTAQEVMQQFNLVVLENLNSDSHVHGRSFIGGNVLGSAQAVFGNDPTMPTSQYAGTTVLGDLQNFGVNNHGLAVGGDARFGNVNSGKSLVMGDAQNVNFNGAAYVGGSTSGYVNFNGGRINSYAADSTLSMYAAAMNSTNFGAVMGGASDAIAALAADSFVTLSGSRMVFNATPGTDGVAVFEVNSFAGVSEFEFNLGAATSVFINSSFSGNLGNINFIGAGPTNVDQLVWNFHDAGTLTFNTQWGGSILATGAHVTNYNSIEGTLVANSFTQRGELHQQPFLATLPVPEPGTWAMFAAGLFGLAALRRRSA